MTVGTARRDPPTDCPTCRRAAVRGRVVSKTGADPYPFCSFRCQQLDLGRWLDEEYRIPDEEPASELALANDDELRGG